MKTQEGTIRGAGICWTLLLMEKGLWSAILIIYNISCVYLGKNVSFHLAPALPAEDRWRAKAPFQEFSHL